MAINVLMVSPAPPPRGGIAQWTTTVLEACQKDSEVNIVHVNSSNPSDTIIGLRKGKRYIESLKQLVKIRRKIKRECQNNRFDVAHLTTSGGVGTLRDSILLRDIKKYHIRTIYHLHFGKYAELIQSGTIWGKLLQDAVNHADTIIAIDPLSLEAASKTGKAKFAPNPICKVDYNYSNNKVILFLGWVAKNKGIEELLAAWDEIKEEYPEWVVRVVGQTNAEYIKYLKEAYSCDRVTFVGELQHQKAMEELKSAAILVLPSHSEGFPYSICEDMFAGKAIVASDVGAIPSLLGDGCGILCRRKDVDDLVKALKAVLSSEEMRKKLSVNARNKAEKELSVPSVMNQYKKIWKDSFDGGNA